MAASAQAPATVTKPDDGYYRIVNARHRTDGKQYVFVTGKIAAQLMPLRLRLPRCQVR